MDKQATLVSLHLHKLADLIDHILEQTAGERLGFALVISVDGTAQYVSNVDRKEGQLLLEHLLEGWTDDVTEIQRPPDSLKKGH